MMEYQWGSFVISWGKDGSGKDIFPTFDTLEDAKQHYIENNDNKIVLGWEEKGQEESKLYFPIYMLKDRPDVEPQKSGSFAIGIISDEYYEKHF